MTLALYRRLVADCLFPLHERLKGHDSLRLRNSLEKSQWFSREMLEARRLARLRQFLTDVNAINPYYADLFKTSGLAPAGFDDPRILLCIPCLTKELIRAHRDRLLSRTDRPPRFMRTSGSSGQPLEFAVGKERISHDIAAKWRATRWWGVDIGEPEAVVWGSDIELSAQGLARQIRDRLMRTRLFPARHLRGDALLALFDRLQAYRPAMIYGYPSILSLLAEAALQQERRFGDGSLKVVFCTAEKLYEHQRQLIEQVFQAPVANGYGSRDAGFIAHECPAGSLHLSAEDIIVEILDDRQQPVPAGTPGEIVVTHMATRAFPMIRYRTGDIGCLATEPCACGRHLPVLADVIGRANDLLRATDGSPVHGAYIGNIVRDDAAIAQFQFTQHGPRGFELKLVCRDGTEPDSSGLRTRLLELLGADAEIAIQRTAAIEVEANGKYKYIVNRCRENRPRGATRQSP
ncbi:phenylacetate--CoA ligase family protein [Marinobacterium aestuariivivens]|uniref:Phenylacetate--CoA ligase family protein n=1 Tax=Marinobacterium aestuariivivens TaxID=1698799 RepID=A0ABW1ZU06_9GAMM